MKHFALAAIVLAFACNAAFAQTKPAQKPLAKAASAAAPAAGGKLKPGLWEIVSATETAGTTAKRTVTSRACYTAEDVGNLQRILPKQREPGMKCETREAKQQGAEVTWRIACLGTDASSLGGTGKMTVGSEAFSGRAELELKAAGAKKPVKVEQTVSGKRIENCK